METHTYATLAGILAASFITDARINGDRFAKLTDDAPEWVKDAVYSAHDGRMPDDGIYNLCASIASDLTEYDMTGKCPEDHLREIADNSVSCYHMDRYRWLAAHLDNSGWCEQAQEEELVASDASMSDRIAAGMYLKAYSVASTLHNAILAQLEVCK